MDEARCPTPFEEGEEDDRISVSKQNFDDVIEMVMALKARVAALEAENGELKSRIAAGSVAVADLQALSKPSTPPRPRKKAKGAGDGLPCSTNATVGGNCNNNSVNSNNNVNNNTVDNGINSNSSNNTGNTGSRKKVIQAIGTNGLAIREQLARASCQSFTVKQNRVNGPVKITVTNEAEIQKVKATLDQNKVSFHEFKFNDEKAKCFVIRGLVGVTEESLPEIKEDLLACGLPASISLSLHVTGYMKSNPGKLHNVPVKLVVPPNFDEKALLNIKYLNHIAVRFEKFKSHSVVQCKNCQRLGHSAGGCQHVHRCVKCGANHLKEDCPRTNNKTIKLRCCNCGGEHTANNLNACSHFAKHVAASSARKAGSPAAVTAMPVPAPRSVRNVANSGLLRPGMSFAAAAASACGTAPRRLQGQQKQQPRQQKQHQQQFHQQQQQPSRQHVNKQQQQLPTNESAILQEMGDIRACLDFIMMRLSTYDNLFAQRSNINNA